MAEAQAKSMVLKQETMENIQAVRVEYENLGLPEILLLIVPETEEVEKTRNGGSEDN